MTIVLSIDDESRRAGYDDIIDNVMPEWTYLESVDDGMPANGVHALIVANQQCVQCDQQRAV